MSLKLAAFCSDPSDLHSKDQFEAMRTAIANWKALKAKLSRLEELSRLVIFHTAPDTRRSKRPTKATLGLGKRPKSP